MSHLDPVDRLIPPDLRVCFKPLEGVQNGGCHMDIYAPERLEDKPVPLAIYIHGGAWVMGASASIPYRQVRWLRERGVAVASVEYRMLPHVDMSALRSDLLDAYRFVQNGLNKALAEQGWSVDPTHVSGWGASAGGGSVLLFAADVLAAKLPPLCAIVPVYPLADFLTYGKQRPRADFEALCESDQAVGSAYKYLMERDCVTSQLWVPAGTPQDPPLAARETFCGAAMRNDLLISLLIGDPPFPASSSPLGVLSADFPPTFVVVATADDLIPPAQSYAIVDTLKRLGVDAQAGEAHGMGHGRAEVHQSDGRWPEGVMWWETAIEPSLEFVLKYLKA